MINLAGVNVKTNEKWSVSKVCESTPVSLLKRYRRSRENQGTRYCLKGPDALSNARYKQSLTPSDIRGRSLISNFEYIEIEGAVRKSLTGGGGHEFFGHFQH